MIERELKKRYIKQLLRDVAKNGKVDCVAPGVKFERLLEIINRRNVHLHNRGVVDEAYRSTENLDGLQIGTFAAIDDAYLQMAAKVCVHCVRQIAAWADPSETPIAEDSKR